MNLRRRVHPALAMSWLHQFTLFSADLSRTAYQSPVYADVTTDDEIGPPGSSGSSGQNRFSSGLVDDVAVAAAEEQRVVEPVGDVRRHVRERGRRRNGSGEAPRGASQHRWARW